MSLKIVPLQRSFTMYKMDYCANLLNEKPVGSMTMIEKHYCDEMTKVYYYIKTENGYEIEERDLEVVINTEK